MKVFKIKTSGLTTIDDWLNDPYFLDAVKACIYLENE